MAPPNGIDQGSSESNFARFWEQLPPVLRRLLYLAVVFFAAVVVVYMTVAARNCSIAGTFAEPMGQAGDYFGGFLNPLLSFVTFLALLYTIRLQLAELKVSSEELKLSRIAAQTQAETLQKSAFESQFYNLIGVFGNFLQNHQSSFRRLYEFIAGESNFQPDMLNLHKSLLSRLVIFYRAIYSLTSRAEDASRSFYFEVFRGMLTLEVSFAFLLAHEKRLLDLEQSRMLALLEIDEMASLDISSDRGGIRVVLNNWRSFAREPR